MHATKHRTGLRLWWLALGAVAGGVGTARAHYYLVTTIDVAESFGPSGTNPYCIASDGTYAYLGGYTSTPPSSNIGVVKINLANPADRMALPGADQTANQYRFYGALVVKGGVLYALCDRPDGLTSATNIRAVDTTTGLLIATFDGDSGTGNGIVTDPAALPGAALGGMAWDPGVGGADAGLSLLVTNTGRRFLISGADGSTLRGASDGMLVVDEAPSCTVVDPTAWRDHVWDLNGDVYMRRSNQVQRAIRAGSNATSSREYLTDALETNGSALADCGDGRPLNVQRQPAVIGQNLALIQPGLATSGQKIVIFNDRHSAVGGQPFSAAVQMIQANGSLVSPPVALLKGDGSPLDAAATPDGTAWYDFDYDAANDRLLILDCANKLIFVFAATPATQCAPIVQDADRDGDVDVSDFVVFQACFNGPDRPWPGPPVDQVQCACLDADKDGDVDVTDFLGFQACFNGPDRPAACS